jgi:hypothetical protein
MSPADSTSSMRIEANTMTILSFWYLYTMLISQVNLAPISPLNRPNTIQEHSRSYVRKLEVGIRTQLWL